MRRRSRTGDAVRNASPRIVRAKASERNSLGALKGASNHTLPNTNRSRGHVTMANEAKCPFSAKTASGRSNADWWPNQLNLQALHTKHPAGDPMGEEFNYAEEFNSLDLAALK